jgi:hypothetical protein
MRRALARHVGEIAAELLEGLVLGFGVLIGDARAAAHAGQRLEHGLAAGARLAQRARRGILLLRHDREQQVLGGYVLVLERLRFGEGGLEHVVRSARQLRLGAAGDLGDLPEHVLDLALQSVERDAELLEHRDGTALGLSQQRAQQMRGLDLTVAPRRGQGLRLRERLLALDGELVVTHGSQTYARRKAWQVAPWAGR